MLSYLLSRWRLSRLFEPHESGYLYRRRLTAEAVLVTAEEREQVFRQFRTAYWKSHAVLWLSFIAGISLTVGIAVAIGAPDNVGTLIGYCSALFLLIAIIYVDRRVFNEAASAVGNRPAVKPARKWYQIQDETLGKTAWWRMIAGGIVLAGLASITFPSNSSATWVWAAWIGYFGFCLTLWIRNIWRKLQIERVG